MIGRKYNSLGQNHQFTGSLITVHELMGGNDLVQRKGTADGQFCVTRFDPANKILKNGRWTRDLTRMIHFVATTSAENPKSVSS